jgi:hypothetical protein
MITAHELAFEVAAMLAVLFMATDGLWVALSGEGVLAAAKKSLSKIKKVLKSGR